MVYWGIVRIKTLVDTRRGWGPSLCAVSVPHSRRSVLSLGPPRLRHQLFWLLPCSCACCLLQTIKLKYISRVSVLQVVRFFHNLRGLFLMLVLQLGNCYTQESPATHGKGHRRRKRSESTSQLSTPLSVCAPLFPFDQSNNSKLRDILTNGRMIKTYNGHFSIAGVVSRPPGLLDQRRNTQQRQTAGTIARDRRGKSKEKSAGNW